MNNIKLDPVKAALAWWGVGAMVVTYCEMRYWCCRTGTPTHEPTRSLLLAIDATLWPVTALSCWVRHGNTAMCRYRDHKASFGDYTPSYNARPPPPEEK